MRTKHWGHSRKGDWRIRGGPSRKERKRTSPLYSYKAIKYRSVLGQINWLQSKRQFQCCHKFSRCAFKGSFSNNWWCESSQQAGETTQVAASETSTLATHRTVENNCVSWCLQQSNEDGSSQRGYDSVCSRITTAFLWEWNVIWKSCWLRKSEGHKNRTLDNRGRIVFIHEMFWFIPVSPSIVDGPVRWGCRKHMTDAKNLATTARTIHMMSMLRKEACSGSIHDLAHISTQNCLADSLSKSSAKADNLMTVVKTERFWEVDVNPNLRTLMEHKDCLSTWCRSFMHTREKNVSFLNAWRISLSQASRERPFHVMFVRTSMGSESQDSTKITSALADPRTCSSVKMMTLHTHMNANIFLLSISPSFLLGLWQCRHQGPLESARQAIRTRNQFMKATNARFLETHCKEDKH